MKGVYALSGTEITQLMNNQPPQSARVAASSNLAQGGSKYRLMQLRNLARTSGYDFEQHDSDWVNRQQLDYLSEPRMVMITNERRLLARIVGSGQEDRVIRLDTLRAAA